MRPIRLPAASLNHSAPSRSENDSGLQPGVMPSLNSVIVPSGVMRPIWLTSVSENQTLPSGPSWMPSGPAFGVGSGNSVNSPLRRDAADLVARSSRRTRDCRRAPSVMPIGVAFGVGRSNSVKVAVFGIEAADLRRAALAEPQAAVEALPSRYRACCPGSGSCARGFRAARRRGARPGLYGQHLTWRDASERGARTATHRLRRFDCVRVGEQSLRHWFAPRLSDQGVRMPGKRVQIDDETWHVLDCWRVTGWRRFRNWPTRRSPICLKKHGRPVTLRAALRQSAGKSADVVPLKRGKKKPSKRCAFAEPG